MFQKIKSFGIKKIIRWIFLFLLSARMFLHLFYSPEKLYQIFKDIELYYAIIIFMVILAVYRKISLKDWKNWLYAILAGVAGVAYFKIKNYRIATLDVDCFKYMVLRTIMQFMFLGLMLDLLRHRPYGNLIKRFKSPMVIFYLLVAIIFPIFEDSSVYPLICPIVALIFTDFSDEDQEELAVILSLGIYFAFIKVFTMSLIEVPISEVGGRYRGYFLNGPTAAESCATAVVACIFLFLLFRKKKNKKLMIVSLVAMLYPLASVFIFKVRGIYLALLFVLFGIYIFLHEKGKKETVKRIGIVALVGVMGMLALFSLSYLLKYLICNGVVEIGNEFHTINTILALSSYGSDTDYFPPGTIINALDNFSSGRIGIMNWFMKQVEFLGHPIEEYVVGDGVWSTGSAHNYFIHNLVRYGILGGGMYILWYVSYIVRFIVKPVNLKEHFCASYSVLWVMYMFAIYMTEAEYFNCTGAFMLLVSMCFVTSEKVTSIKTKTES